ncbi:MAG TPA: tetratricopeptide repeat protein [Burkholderiales bacterium]|nr:tetratricopeptide repeat protein [Burkholderiales bacterium]
MATYDLEEQEKIEELKAWWKQYGTLIITTTALALIIIAGMRFWDGYQRTQSVEANAVYNRLLQAVQADEGSKVAELSALVRDDYSRTVYASLGTFAAAKYHVEKGELEAAREQLAWAAENARDAQLKAVARLRLAQVLIDLQRYDEALQQLEAEHPAAFTTQYAQTRGDIYALQGKTGEARTAYQAALAATSPAERTLRELLQFKIDNLGAV